MRRITLAAVARYQQARNGGELRQDDNLSAPKPGQEWKIDRVNRVLLHDGRPQFVYGILLGGWDGGFFSSPRCTCWGVCQPFSCQRRRMPLR